MKNTSIESKLPHVGTNIFSEMTALAKKHHAINLSQGFPEFDTPDFLKKSVIQSIQEGYNQYPPSSGILDLQQQIQQLVKREYNLTIDAETNVTITSGATESIFVAIQCLISPGDEVIIFDPAYDAYAPSVQLAGGQCIHIPLSAPDYRINWDHVQHHISPRTRLIIINSPHNPTGTLLEQNDLQTLENIVLENNCFVISDEVYEFITFDNKRHESVLRYPTLFEHSFVISSFGKSFHCTGWKVGYAVAPKTLTQEFRKIHQYVTFATFTPAQMGIAAMLKEYPHFVNELSSFYQKKRDYFVHAISDSKLNILPCHGTYFLLVDYHRLSDKTDKDFCYWLAENVGVGAVPMSPFYQEPNKDRIIRLCFAKNENTLQQAAKCLSTL